MKESGLRRWHRNIGITLALFIFLQTGSGWLISVGELATPHTNTHELDSPLLQKTDENGSLWNDALRFMHHGGDTIGSLYRLLVGIGMLGMAISGSMIFFKLRARIHKNQAK